MATSVNYNKSGVSYYRKPGGSLVRYVGSTASDAYVMVNKFGYTPVTEAEYNSEKGTNHNDWAGQETATAGNEYNTFTPLGTKPQYATALTKPAILDSSGNVVQKFDSAPTSNAPQFARPESDFQAAATQPGVTTTSQAKYQILDLASMAKYKTTDYKRNSDWSVILNSWVAPIPGTVKEIGGASTTGVTSSGTSSWTSSPKSSSTSEKTDSELAAEQQAAADKIQMDTINKYIEWLWLDESQKLILRQLSKETFASWTKFYQPKDIDNLLKVSAENAKTSLDPYYTKETAREIDDLKNKMTDIRNQSALYTQNERKSYAEKLKDTKDVLRAKWLTFSGMSRRVIWQEAGTETTTNAERSVEWEIPQQRRYDISEQENAYRTRAREAWLASERKLGSWILNPYQADLGSIASPYQGWIKYQEGWLTPLYKVSQAPQWLETEAQALARWYVKTGDLSLDQIKEIEKRKWANIWALRQS